MSEPILIMIMGGPFSGKSCLAEALHTHFPGIAHVSGEEMARMVSASGQSSNVVPASQGKGGKCKGGVPHTTPTKSTVLSRKKVILTAVSQQACVCTNYGMAITGFQAEDLPLFESIVGIEVSCVIVINCSAEVLIDRSRQVLPAEVTGTWPVKRVRKR